MADASDSFSWPEDWKSALPAIERRVRSRCAQAGSSEADTEDIYSLVREKVWLATKQPARGKTEIRQFPTIGKLLNWCGVITTRIIIKRWRKKSGERYSETIDPAELSAPDPLTGDLSEYLKILPPLERTALRLRFEQDLSYAKIADEIDKSVGYAHGLVQKALLKIKEEIER